MARKSSHRAQFDLPAIVTHGKSQCSSAIRLEIRLLIERKRELEGFAIEEVAGHFGVLETGAVAVRKIGDLLSPSYFVQAQIFPYGYQDVVVRGNATKIDALFLREYLHQRQSVPQVGESRPFAGGYRMRHVTALHSDIKYL